MLHAKMQTMLYAMQGKKNLGLGTDEILIFWGGGGDYLFFAFGFKKKSPVETKTFVAALCFI